MQQKEAVQYSLEWFRFILDDVSTKKDDIGEM